MIEDSDDLFKKPLDLKDPRRIFTVSEITQDIKLILENTFSEVWIEGEISNFKAANSGHFYFTLKDKSAVLAAAMFTSANKNLRFKLEDGLKVICFGKIDVYSPRGQYQLIVQRIEPKGIGAQQLAFEQLKERLFKEGLFDPKHKKPLPLMAFRVGIVTSSKGAAIRDILQILKNGAGCADVLLRSVRVQGEFAAKEIAEGIKELNEYENVDVIIISRGGGSIEDLWPFNEEIVARAVYNSRIPVISAVGHQINVTISDLVSDVFVETPSAAAKIIVDKKNSLLAELDGLKHTIHFSISGMLNQWNNTLTALRHMLKSPLDRLLEKQQLVDEIRGSLNNNMRYTLDVTKEKFAALLERLNALSPLAVLSRGYSLSMLMPEEMIIKDTTRLKAGSLIKTILSKGAFVSKVEEVIVE
ncbi:MAG: exodeoxyribonuclease VII large subunit [Candidatus Omnitrophota bacterium]